jgi:hypothetical protein
MRNLKSTEHLIQFHEVHETKKAIILVLKYDTKGKSYMQFKPKVFKALIDCIAN